MVNNPVKMKEDMTPRKAPCDKLEVLFERNYFAVFFNTFELAKGNTIPSAKAPVVGPMIMPPREMATYTSRNYLFHVLG